MVFLQMLGTSPRGALTEWWFIYEEGQAASLTGNGAAVINALVHMIAAACLWKHVKRAINKTKETDRLKHIKKEPVRSYVLFGILVVSAVLGLNIFFEIGGLTDKLAAYKLYVEDAYRVNFLIGAVCTCVIIPITEEWVFRGAIFNALKKLYKPSFAILMSGILCGLFYQDSIQGIHTALIGCIAAYAYEYYGRFAAPVIVHVAAAIVSYLITYTPLVNTVLYSMPVCLLFVVAAIVVFRAISLEKKL